MLYYADAIAAYAAASVFMRRFARVERDVDYYCHFSLLLLSFSIFAYAAFAIICFHLRYADADDIYIYMLEGYIYIYAGGVAASIVIYIYIIEC